MPPGLAWRLIVVDNASTDDTVDVVARVLPVAEVLQMGRNAGYAAAINAAVAAAGDVDQLLVLNPDVRVARGAVERLMDTLAQPGTGIAAPRLVDGEGRVRWSLRRDPTVARAWGEALVGGRRAGRVPRWGEMVTAAGDYVAAHEVDWTSGAALMISSACRDAVGGWDESFFLYSEETDFALRARELGFAVRYEPAATVVHLEGESHTSPQLWALLVTNRLRLFRRHNGRLATALFWAALMAGEGLRSPRSPVHRAAVVGLLAPSRVRARIVGDALADAS